MPTGVYPRQKVAPCDRVLAKVEVHPLGCWIFTGALTESGYGKVNVDRIPRLVHRVVYEEMVGVIPEGLTLDHLCGTCACVNPSHLEPVTAAENTRRQWAAERANAGVRQRERTHPASVAAVRVGGRHEARDSPGEKGEGSMSRLFADLSNNNPHLKADVYAASGHMLVGLKATQGETFTDRNHGSMSVRAHKAGVAVAHYHFAEPAHSAVVQARFFWRVTRPHFKKGRDYLILDLEWEHPKGAAAARDWARQFHRELRAISGHSCVLYTGRSFLGDYLGPRIRAGRGSFQRFWIAEYGPRLNGVLWARPAWAWQRTDGKVGRPPYHLSGCPPFHDVNVLNVRSYRRLRGRR